MKRDEMEGNEINDGIGEVLGDEAFEQALLHGEEYFVHERRRIEIANEPACAALRAELADLQEEDDDVSERLRHAAHSKDARTRRRKLMFYRCVAAALMLGGLALTVYGLLPFRFGVLIWAIGLAASTLTPFGLDETVEAWEGKTYGRLPRIAVTSLFIIAMSAQLLLGAIRSQIMHQQLDSPTSAVVVEGEPPITQAHDDATFYNRTEWCLMLFMPLLAVAMELGSGWALWRARQYNCDSIDDPDELKRQRRVIRQQMITKGADLVARQGAGAEWEHGARRDFKRRLRSRARNGSFLKLLLILATLILAHRQSFAAVRLNIVAAVDFSGSVLAARGLDGKTELDRNIAAVSQLLAKAPAGAKITVLAITDQTFSRPYVLLTADVGTDEGYFQERIQLVRKTLVETWQKRSRNFVLGFHRTDLLGSLVVASQLFGTRPGWRDVLLIFSDMRDTAGVQLNTKDIVPVASVLKEAEKRHLIADLKGVQVFALGVDGAGKDVAYWQTLREFWVEYFKKSGAALRAYSMMRETPNFAGAAANQGLF